MDLIDLTGKYRGYVSRYLYNMRNYGLVEKNGSFWKLTDSGLSLLSYLKSIDIDINKKRKKAERTTKEGRKLRQKTPKQISIGLWLQHSDLDVAEKVVVEVLVDHYNLTGGPFLWFSDIYDLAERLKLSPSLLPPALRKLTEDQIIYIWRHKKIGLKKAFVQMLGAEAAQ